jgi:hypothetical protein
MVHALLFYSRGPAPRGGHAQLCFESAFAIPQLEGSTSVIIIPLVFQEMCLCDCNSAILNRIFSISPQLESFISAIFGVFLAVDQVFFAIQRILIGSSTRFSASVFFVNQPHMKIIYSRV